MSEFTARLVAYEPDGPRIGPLPRPTNWEVSFPHDDDGALTLTYSSLAARGELIERGLLTGLEVAVEIADHAGVWDEPEGGRFMLVTRGGDGSDQTKSRVLTLPAISWLMGKARNNDTSSLYPAGHAQAGKRGFEAASAGGVLAQLLAENAALDGITLDTDATASLDSAGVAWAQVANRAYNVGDTLRAIREDLVGIGLCNWRTQGRTLRLYNPDTATGTDRSATVQLRLGTDVGEAPSTETLENLVHSVLVRTEAGGTTTVDAVGVAAPWGKWQGYLPIGAVDTEADAIVAGQAEVDRYAKVGAQYTRSLTLPGAKFWPLVDYDRGEWITAPTTGPGESVRVQQITITYGPEGFTGSVVLNDRFLVDELRRAKALAAVTGAASSVSPTGGVTPPDSYASRQPAAPSGLLLDTDVYVDAGVNRALITASWVGPTVGVDGAPITAASYVVQWRYGVSGPWSAGLPSTDDQLTIPGLTLGSAAQVRVRSVTASGIPGPFTAPSSITTASDVTAPQAPSTPTISCRLGVISVTWNGSPAAGSWPADFARVDVAIGPTTTPTTVVDSLTRAGSVKVTGQTYGSTRYARLRAVDQSGNVGAWSAASLAVLVVGVSGPDLEANSVTANAIAVGALDGILITGATIRTDAGSTRLEMTTAGLTAWSSGTAVAEFLPGGLYLRQGGELVVEYPAGGDALKVGFLDTAPDIRGLEVRDLAGNVAFRVATRDASAYTTITMANLDFLTVTNTTSVSVNANSSVSLSGGGATPSVLSLNASDAALRSANGVGIFAIPGAVFPALSAGQIIEAYDNSWRVQPHGVPTWAGGPLSGTLAIHASNSAVSVAYGTDTLAANTYLTTSGGIRRTSSSLRYKQDVEDLQVDLAAVLAMRPRTWRDKRQVEEDPTTTLRIPGFIAEELDALGLIEFVTYEANGPESIQYDRLAAAQQLVLIDHEARLTDALTRLAALEAA